MNKMFIVMSLGFASMAVINQGYLPRYSKVINAFSWIFVIVAAMLFLYAIQTGAL